MKFRLYPLFVFCILLIPSAQFAWKTRDMPNFGSFHDDGIILTSAKSIAEGNGYRIESLPSNPAQTKYPPLYPLFLSMVWHLDSHFPDNLVLAMLFNWVVVATALGLCWLFYRDCGFSENRIILLTALIAINPYVIVLGTSMLSEVFFTCFALASLLLARRSGNTAILLAGAAALAAYLTRTAGMALLMSLFLALAWKREWRRCALFAAVTAPGVAAWALWTGAHKIANPDPTLLYYTDYWHYQFANVNLSNLGPLVWNNIDQIVYGMGALILPKVMTSLPWKLLTEVIGVAMIAGTVRLIRKGTAVDYGWFAAVSVAILVFWHGPPTERLAVPLFPLLLAGFVAELEHLGSMLSSALRHHDRSQRTTAVLFGGTAAAVIGGACCLQLYMVLAFLPASARASAHQRDERIADYQWLANNLPPEASILSYDDPLLYLYIGHHGSSIPMPIRWWYPYKDHANMINAFSDLDSFCKSHGLQYVYASRTDLSRETDDDDRKAVEQLMRANSQLTPIHTASLGTVYRVVP